MHNSQMFLHPQDPLEYGWEIVKIHQRFPTGEETPSNQLAKISQIVEVTKNPSANTFELSQWFTKNVVNNAELVVG